MSRLFILGLISVIGSVCSEVHKGRYLADSGNTIQYHIENNDDYAQLLLHLISDTSHDPIVNTTLVKLENDIIFHILGNDHIESTEHDFEDEAKLTKELMQSGVGMDLPSLSHYVFQETGITGAENPGMMLLHQLAMFSHDFHEGKHTPTRRKRNALDSLFQGHEKTSNDVEGVFTEDIVKLCNGGVVGENGGCTVDLCVVGSDNHCRVVGDDNKHISPAAHRFTAHEIEKGCYGLCGPWCTCWKQVCGDCCWHPGCFQHDQYCDNPSSMSCKLGKGVVYGLKGLHVC